MSPAVLRPLETRDHVWAIRLLGHLNPDCSRETLKDRFERILREHPHYHPAGLFLDEEMVAFGGAWIGTKVWCGRYLEIDNLVVHPDHRSQGYGSQLMTYFETLARERDCNLVVLDSYASNHSSHRLYHRLGYEIWGFHFVKEIGNYRN